MGWHRTNPELLSLAFTLIAAVLLWWDGAPAGVATALILVGAAWYIRQEMLPGLDDNLEALLDEKKAEMEDR